MLTGKIAQNLCSISRLSTLSTFFCSHFSSFFPQKKSRFWPKTDLCTKLSTLSTFFTAFNRFFHLSRAEKDFLCRTHKLTISDVFSYFPLTSFDTGLFGSGSHQGSAAAMKLTSEAVTGINEKLIKIVFAITLYFLSLSKKYAILKSSQIKELIVCVIRSLEEISK